MMKIPGKVGYALVGGVVGGVLLYQWSESSVPKDANCSYLASPATDMAAFVLGAYGVYRGFQKQEWFLSFLGSAVASTHLMQYINHKGIPSWRGD